MVGTAGHFAGVVIALHHCLHVETLKDLLLNDVLVQNLVIEIQWLFVNQLVVEAFAISWLHDVTLRINAVLVSLLRRRLVLALEFLFLLNSVSVVLNKSLGRRYFKLDDASVVQFVDCLIECLWVDTLSLLLKLPVKLSELVLNSLCLQLKLFVVESVLGLAINTKFFFIGVLEGLLVNICGCLSVHFVLISRPSIT